ncbi:OmpA family protein [Marinobacter sp. X15-166B]|uniref:MotY family protein n=1 Tax=Marinobacter sp. X15-166B TaxID=1897620 RepID=UPI00224483B0|nr:OmpA family protein [Marinobacter sp. X15-166B]
MQVGEGRRSLALGPEQTQVMAQGLLRGMTPTVTRQAWYGGEPVRVRLSNINFAPRFSAYQGCVAGLLPANFEQIKHARIPFAVDSAVLSAADERLLDSIVAYVLADTTVERVLVDGHTDHVGSRIHNRALSEQRANAVAEYLLAHGVPAELVIVRAHGERFPVSRRAADNRRTTVRLEREGDRSSFQQAAGYRSPDSNG